MASSVKRMIPAGGRAHGVLADGALMLGIESSCDESAAALYSPGRGLLAHLVRSQDESHCAYGGVVPEIAARDHQRALLPLVHGVLGGRRPDAVACTAGPGLSGCLVAGVSLAQALALAWRVPLAPVNHLEGHLLSPFLDCGSGFDFPYLCLLVSGGHTVIYDVPSCGCYRLLGTTLDDAAGEGFDKTAKLLGLPYPGGAELERLARSGDARLAAIPAAMTRSPSLDMSFSGLKTAARRRLEEGCAAADIAAAFQRAAVATLVDKTEAALASTGRARLAVVGGVGRNRQLRAALAAAAGRHSASLHHPAPEFCVDNAAMIALAGCHRMARGYAVEIRPRWLLGATLGAASHRRPLR